MNVMRQLKHYFLWQFMHVAKLANMLVFVVKDHQLVAQGSQGVKDMGDPQTLTDFIKWGQDNYAADRYVLVLWDHGGGALADFGGYAAGVVPKPDYFASRMTFSGIRKAISDAVGDDQARRFELIGFDACLMGTLEIAVALKDVNTGAVSE